jgi:uncharacterized protein (DUF1810 family)
VRDTRSDPYRLERFVAAQDAGGTYDRAVAELRAGAKVSHWMWFVFPQIAGLGLSTISRQYAIGSLDEARAYLAHPVLGPRLRECARIVAGTAGRSAERIFGPVDAMKLRSSMTLFAAADSETVDGEPVDGEPAGGEPSGGEPGDGEPGGNVFRAVLAKYFDGTADEATASRLLPRRGHPLPRRSGQGLLPKGPAHLHRSDLATCYRDGPADQGAPLVGRAAVTA